MTRIFINGQQVRKEDLKNYEIKDEGVKRIIREAMYRKQANRNK